MPIFRIGSIYKLAFVDAAKFGNPAEPKTKSAVSSNQVKTRRHPERNPNKFHIQQNTKKGSELPFRALACIPYSSRETYPDSRKDMANISKIQIKTKKQAVIKGKPFKKSKIIPIEKHYINKVKSKKMPKFYIFTFFYSEKFAGLQKSSIFASQFSKTLVATLNNGALDEWLSLWSAKPATAVRIRQAPR